MIEILLGILALLGNCGWLLSGKKYRQEVRSAKADAQQKEFDLSAQYVKEFKENICAPLKEEVERLRTAIEAVNSCPHSDDCPVIDKLHEPSQSGASNDNG